jgi:conjugal transfer pilus assembly protein TraV
MKTIYPFFIASILLSGCALTGLDASSKFSCKAAPGVSCESISGVHENVSAGNLPFQRAAHAQEKPDERKGEEEAFPVYDSMRGKQKLSPREMIATYSGQPVRSPVLVLRTWVAPYEDENGDLFDQSYFYTVVNTGKWMIEANRAAISNQFRPIYPLQRPSNDSSEKSAP